ncbi:MAG: hypothetical protein WC028_02665 [Candidatus Obscuribacterales bacterium]
MQEKPPKPSRLSKEQVVWLNCLILALLYGRLGMGGYIFANEQLEDLAITLWCLLLAGLAVVVSMGPNGRVRTISLVLTIPLAVLMVLLSCARITRIVDEHPEGIGFVAKVKDVTFETVAQFDVTYDGISRQFRELRMERPAFNGILKKQESLISVQPADAAEAELSKDGKTIHFTSPALLGRKAIVRTYSTDWDEALKKSHEIIELTREEQKNH